MNDKRPAEFSRLLWRSAHIACMLALLLLPLKLAYAEEERRDGIPEAFVDIHQAVPSISLDVRYFSADNFVGGTIDGYEVAKIYLTRATADALKAVQEELAEQAMGLKIFDGYRPQMAVDHFVRWAEDLADTSMKQRYYPAVEKKNLFRDGYIAKRSGHSRGSAVDLTLIALDSKQELDMGSGWDFFDPISWPSSLAVSQQQRANRLMLRTVMLKHGFLPLKQEWWHFSLENEAFPDSYFEFQIR